MIFINWFQLSNMFFFTYLNRPGKHPGKKDGPKLERVEVDDWVSASVAAMESSTQGNVWPEVVTIAVEV